MSELRERIAAEVRRGWPDGSGKKSGALLVADRILALLDGGERPEPVAWRRWEQSKYGEGWIYYETPAWPDAEPLYASPAGRTPVSEGERYTLKEIDMALYDAHREWDATNMRGLSDLVVAKLRALRSGHEVGGR